MEAESPIERRQPTQFSQNQALPSIAQLTSNIPQPDVPTVSSRPHSDIRDSGNWSISQSKHSSTLSNTTGLQLQTILNSDDSPSRNSVTDLTSRYSSQMSSGLPSLSQGFEHKRVSLEQGPHLESRRSSIDSRMNTGMGHLHINPSSPYESQNASRASLVSSLQHQRGITNEPRTNGTTPLSPVSARGGPRSTNPPRRAPVINPNPRSVSGMPDPMAAAPTKGFAWAFPGEADPEDERRRSSSGDSSGGRSMSRQNSYPASAHSSIYTADSGMPAGQRRFEEDMLQTHHHSIQQRAAGFRNSDQGSIPGTGNYSRTPELRVSHKMAERKRRSEMKQLFDELNCILPNSPGGKCSKWEILTKSIDYIKTLIRTHDAARNEITRLKADLEFSRRAQEENDLLRSEMTAMLQHLRTIEPNKSHVYGSMSSVLSQQHGQTTNGSSGLPGLQPPAQWQGTPTAVPMQGVEFGAARPYEHH